MSQTESEHGLRLIKCGLDLGVRNNLVVRPHPTTEALDSLYRDAKLVCKAANKRDKVDIWHMIKHRMTRHPKRLSYIATYYSLNDDTPDPTPAA